MKLLNSVTTDPLDVVLADFRLKIDKLINSNNKLKDRVTELETTLNIVVKNTHLLRDAMDEVYYDF